MNRSIDTKRRNSARRTTGSNCSSTAASEGLPDARTSAPWKSSSAATAAIASPDSTAAENRLVGLTHLFDDRGGQVRHRQTCGEFVHGGDDVTGVAHGALVHLGHDRRASRPGHDQPARREPQQRFAYRRPTHAEPFRELAVPEALAGRERAVDDRVPQAHIDVIAEERAADWRVVRGIGMRCIAHRIPASVKSRRVRWEPEAGATSIRGIGTSTSLLVSATCNILHAVGAADRERSLRKHRTRGRKEAEMNTTDQEIKNVVLVHGAFADGSGWRGVYDNLTARGYRVTIVQNPLTSLEDDVAATTRVLDLQDGPTILVGHSWGGTVITEAGVHPKVAGLVYVSALAPDAGETTAQQYEGFAETPDFVIDVVDDGYGFLNREKFKAGFAARRERRRRRVPARRAGARSTCRSSRRRSRTPRGATSRAGRSSPPRTSRSTRPCCSTWPSARARRSRTSRPATPSS